jgi:hypothetical protein
MAQFSLGTDSGFPTLLANPFSLERAALQPPAGRRFDVKYAPLSNPKKNAI